MPKLFIVYGMIGDSEVIDAINVVANSKAEAEAKAMEMYFSELAVPCYADAYETPTIDGYKINLSKEGQ